MADVLFEFRSKTGALVRIVCADITTERVDAIVNAANETLRHGGGVAGAIVRAGGESIQEESDAWVQRYGPVDTGTAAITGAGRLNARHVIHAVGPVWGTGDEDGKLAAAVEAALRMARDKGLKTISLPAISSGVFGFPKERCAKILLDVVNAFDGLEEIRLCNHDGLTAGIFVREAERFRS